MAEILTDRSLQINRKRLGVAHCPTICTEIARSSLLDNLEEKLREWLLLRVDTISLEDLHHWIKTRQDMEWEIHSMQCLEKDRHSQIVDKRESVQHPQENLETKPEASDVRGGALVPQMPGTQDLDRHENFLELRASPTQDINRQNVFRLARCMQDCVPSAALDSPGSIPCKLNTH